MRFVLYSIRGKILATLLTLAVAAVILLVTGWWDDDPRSQEEKNRDRIARVNERVEESVRSAGMGLRIYEAENRLMVDGDYERYRIDRTEMVDGDFNVFTKLPPGKASERKVARLCTKLIGGEEPLLEVRDFVFVFGQGLEHIRADQCDIQHWQEPSGPVG